MSWGRVPVRPRARGADRVRNCAQIGGCWCVRAREGQIPEVFDSNTSRTVHPPARGRMDVRFCKVPARPRGRLLLEVPQKPPAGPSTTAPGGRRRGGGTAARPALRCPARGRRRDAGRRRVVAGAGAGVTLPPEVRDVRGLLSDAVGDVSSQSTSAHDRGSGRLEFVNNC